jgi:hypothetical protein
MTLKDEIAKLRKEEKEDIDRLIEEGRVTPEGKIAFKQYFCGYEKALGHVLNLLINSKCRNCKWWDREDEHWDMDNCRCTNPKFVYESEHGPRYCANAVVYSPDDSPPWMGPGFGCIHFDGKEEEVK